MTESVSAPPRTIAVTLLGDLKRKYHIFDVIQMLAVGFMDSCSPVFRVLIPP
jgi:hypothetical protein